MNPVHAHLVLNHVAILSGLFSLVIFFSGLYFSERILLRTAMVGFVFSALVTIPVFLTGEPAEEAVEELPGISHALIESHEEAAEFSIWVVQLLGLVSLFGLFAPSTYDRTVKYLISGFGIVSVVSMIYTGLEGGKIRHTEIQVQSQGAVIQPVESDHHEEHEH